MKRGWLVIVLLLSLGANLGIVAAVVAHRRSLDRWTGSDRRFDGEHERLPDRPGERIAEHLGLDPSRRARFVATHRRMAQRAMEARREIGRVRFELRREVGARDPDRAEIDRLLAEIAVAESALNRAVVEGILEARAELAPREARDYLRMLEQLGPPGVGPERRGFRDGGAPFARRFEGEPLPSRDEPVPGPEALPPPEP